jgi:hypothetical protein
MAWQYITFPSSRHDYDKHSSEHSDNKVIGGIHSLAPFSFYFIFYFFSTWRTA